MTAPDEPVDDGVYPADWIERVLLAEEYGVDPRDISIYRRPGEEGRSIVICTLPYGGGMWNSGAC